MPLYEYVCSDGHVFQQIRSITDDTEPSKCEVCKNPVRQVLGNVGIKFNGSGFYSTDKRK